MTRGVATRREVAALTLSFACNFAEASRCYFCSLAEALGYHNGSLADASGTWTLLEIEKVKKLQHLVRFGNLGHLGRYSAADGRGYPRRSRVICRTPRGLEVGVVLASGVADSGQSDGSLLRGVTDQDELLLERIERLKNAAFRACSDLLRENGVDAVLMDVEHLFDGQSLVFHFLGEIDEEVEALTSQLAEAYEAKVQFRKFTEAVIDGCGPGCGTEESAGCSSGACATCSLAGGCGTRTSVS